MILNFIGAFLLILIGLFIIIVKKNLIKIVLGMGLMGSGIRLLLISIGFRTDGVVPVFTQDLQEGLFFVDPVPQALVITLIVIGACIITLSLLFIIRFKQQYGTIDLDRVRRMKE